MHATYPGVVRHHPGWFGILAGLFAGILLTFAVLLAMDRVDLTALIPATPVTVQTPSDTYAQHWAREHPEDVRAVRAGRVLTHFEREHRGDIAGN